MRLCQIFSTMKGQGTASSCHEKVEKLIRRYSSNLILNKFITRIYVQISRIYWSSSYVPGTVCMQDEGIIIHIYIIAIYSIYYIWTGRFLSLRIVSKTLERPRPNRIRSDNQIIRSEKKRKTREFRTRNNKAQENLVRKPPRWWNK